MLYVNINYTINYTKLLYITTTILQEWVVTPIAAITDLVEAGRDQPGQITRQNQSSTGRRRYSCTGW